MRKILFAAMILAASTASAALAAEAPPPNAALGGPLIKGVCLLSKDAVLVNAKAAVAIDTRLKQIQAQAQAEVDANKAPVEADLKALQADAAKTPTPPAADIERRRQAIQARYLTVQALAEQRNREVLATRQKALDRLSSQMQPVLAVVYKARGCGLLLDRNSVLGGNTGGDLTADVIKGLDAKSITITFDRETLPPPAKK